jgi:N-acetylglucosamine-6-sulfatase
VRADVCPKRKADNRRARDGRSVRDSATAKWLRQAVDRTAGAALVCFGLIVCASLLATGAGDEIKNAKADAPARPSFVVVITDDQDVTSMAVMRKVRRHLARRGTTFENFYATLPACCPSRATLLTGQYAHNHGVRTNEWTTGGGFRAFTRTRAYSRTIASALRRAGYRTAWLGRYLNGYDPMAQARPSLRPPGWSRWLPTVDGARLYGWRLNENGRLRRYSGSRGYQTDVLARKAARFIRRSARHKRPFFVTVATSAVHGDEGRAKKGKQRRNPRPARRHWGAFAREPLPRPPSFNAPTRGRPSFAKRRSLSKRNIRKLARLNRSRRETLLAVDDLVGRLVRQLRRVKRLKNTYLIFTSDNGFALGEHRLRGKQLLSDAGARVPMVIRGPGIPAGTSRRQITGNIDIAPTILRAARARRLLRTDGVSLRRLAAKPKRGRNRAILLTHSARAIGAMPRPRADWRSRGVRVRGWVYIKHRSRRGTEHELYDLDQDPHQLRNLAPRSNPKNPQAEPRLVAKRRELTRRLQRLRGCSGSSCR